MAYERRHNRGSVYIKGRKIFVKFRYHKNPVEYATGELDTPENREHWEKWLDNALDAIDEGKFVYAKVFPSAKPHKKALFARLEGRAAGIDPSMVTMGQVIRKYRDEVVPNFTSKSTRDAYESKIRSRILPYFDNMTFSEFNSNEAAKFIGTLAGTQKKKKRS